MRLMHSLLLTAMMTAPAALVPTASPAQASHLPFSIGERLTYKVSVAKLGSVGQGAMWIEGPVDVRGVTTYLLRIDFSGGKGPVRAMDQTSSWLDPDRMSARRFFKREKHVLARHEERVEMFPSEKRWSNTEGDNGSSPTDAPLDELSFMYFIRTLSLADRTEYRFDRHFDVRRSPTSLSVIRREKVKTGAGTFWTVLVEMRVKDPRRYKGEGLIRINLTDDAARLPVRIQSTMPVVGSAVMTLESYYTPAQSEIARLD